MSEHLRALLVVLVLTGIVFWAASLPRVALPMAPEDFRRRRNAFVATILAAFLTHDFWLFMAVMAVVIRVAASSERNPVALYLAMALAVPPYFKEIPGFLGLEHFFALDPPRLLSLLLLLPTWLVLRSRPGTERFGSLLPDKLLFGYLAVYAGTTFYYDSFTAGLRAGLFYPFLDFFLPYYVASRSLRSLAAFRDLATTLALVAAALSVVAMFEFSRAWLLYAALEDSLGVVWTMNNYLFRGNFLRAQATLGHSIAFGYLIVIAFSMFALLRPGPRDAQPTAASRRGAPVARMGLGRWVAAVARQRPGGSHPSTVPAVMARTAWWLGAAALAGGLVAALSRGPWVGAATAMFVYALLAPNANVALVRLALVAGGLGFVLVNTEIGQEVLSFLPFVGTVDAGGVTYRQQLFETSLLVIAQRPFFGSIDYYNNPLMEVMRQGEGIIDIVNTYLQVTLRTGLVGLACFAGVFLVALAGTFSTMSRLSDKGGDAYRVGRSLLAATLGALMTVVTVSSILMIPMLYWVLAGLLVGYRQWLAAPQEAKAPLGARDRASAAMR